MDKQILLQFYKAHKGEILGAGIGFALAVTVLLLGILKAIFIVICVVFGYYIGKKLSHDKDYVKNLLDRILPPGTYR